MKAPSRRPRNVKKVQKSSSSRDVVADSRSALVRAPLRIDPRRRELIAPTHFAAAHATRRERSLRPDVETVVVEAPPAPPRNRQDRRQQDARDDRARARDPSRSSLAASARRARRSFAPSSATRVARVASTPRRKHSRGEFFNRSPRRARSIARGRRARAVASPTTLSSRAPSIARGARARRARARRHRRRTLTPRRVTPPRAPRARRRRRRARGA